MIKLIKKCSVTCTSHTFCYYQQICIKTRDSRLVRTF